MNSYVHVFWCRSLERGLEQLTRVVNEFRQRIAQLDDSELTFVIHYKYRLEHLCSRDVFEVTMALVDMIYSIPELEGFICDMNRLTDDAIKSATTSDDGSLRTKYLPDLRTAVLNFKLVMTPKVNLLPAHIAELLTDSGCCREKHIMIPTLQRIHNISVNDFFIPKLLESLRRVRGEIKKPKMQLKTYQSVTIDVTQDLPFQHSTLPTTSSIRLVRYTPQHDRPAQPFDISIEIVDLEEKPEYLALSYTWDRACSVFSTKHEMETSPPRQAISCHGKFIEIEDNLYRFLVNFDPKKHLTADGSREFQGSNVGTGWLIWIDALCIDQENVEERNHQVRLMGKIYRRCTQVLIWLGDDDGLVEPALRLCSCLHDLQSPVNSYAYAAAHEHLHEIKRLRWSSSLVPLAAFFRRNWFFRVWVIQEVAFAPRLSFLCGAIVIDWHYLPPIVDGLRWSGLVQRATDLISEELDDTVYVQIGRRTTFNEDGTRIRWQRFPRGKKSDQTLFSSMEHRDAIGTAFTRLESIRRKYMDCQSHLSLLELLKNSRKMQCTDARDKVYALLELVEGASLTLDTLALKYAVFNIDYGKPVRRIYTEAAWYVLLNQENLDLLSEAECMDRDCQELHQLPSWVPDWRRILTHESFASVNKNVPRWSAADDVKWIHQSMPCSDIYQLALEGRKIGTISLVTNGSEYCRAAAVLLACTLPALYLEKSPGRSSFEVLWRTLLADCIDGITPAPSLYDDIFRRDLVRTRDDVLTNILSVQERQPSSFGDYEPQITAELESAKSRYEKAFDILEIHDKWVEPHSSTIPKLDEIEVEQRMAFCDREKSIARSRLLFRTVENHLGLGPRTARPTDEVWIVAGSTRPLILSPRSDGKYRLIGDAYVHGIMHGEEVKRPGFAFQSIVLV